MNPHTPVSPSRPAVLLSDDAVMRARGIRLLAFDVDGTLTDGGLYIGNSGEMMKRFSVRDGFGLNLVRRAGLKIAIVTGRESEIVARRAQELSFDALVQGARDKRVVLERLCAGFSLAPQQVLFMGDDWPDLPAMQRAGLAATVHDAPAELKSVAHFIGTAPPGHGAVREVCEWLLEAQGLLAGLRGEYLK